MYTFTVDVCPYKAVYGHYSSSIFQMILAVALNWSKCGQYVIHCGGLEEMLAGLNLPFAAVLQLCCLH